MSLEVKRVRELSSVCIFVIVLASALAGCGLADIRPDGLKHSAKLTDAQVERGRAIIERMQEANGGRHAWMAHQVAQITLDDAWPGLLERNTFMPWSVSPAQLRLTMALGKDQGRLEFLNGEDKGSAWGVQRWATYLVEPGGLPKFKAHEDAWFYVPTLSYFIEAHMRLHEGQYIAYGGQRKRDGRTYDLVYITWGSAAPRDDIDQYVAWIDNASFELRYLEFTVRDLYGFLTAVAIYEDWHEVQGVKLAKTITIADGIDDQEDVLHRMTIKSASFNPELPQTFLSPDPRKWAHKSDRGQAR